MDMLHIDITLKDVVAIGFAIQAMQRGDTNHKVRVLTKIPCFSDLNVAMGCEQAFIDHVASTASEIANGDWGNDAYTALYEGVSRATAMLIKAEAGHAGKN